MALKILALDVATKTGWAVDGTSGTWDFKPRKGESVGMRIVRLKAAVREMIKLNEIDLVVYERAAGVHKNSIIVESEMIGALVCFLLEEKINYTCYSAKEIKKYATGNGNAGKLLMIKAANEKLGYTGNDDNEADALWLYQLATYDLITRDKLK